MRHLITFGIMALLIVASLLIFSCSPEPEYETIEKAVTLDELVLHRDFTFNDPSELPDDALNYYLLLRDKLENPIPHSQPVLPVQPGLVIAKPVLDTWKGATPSGKCYECSRFADTYVCRPYSRDIPGF